MERNSYNKHLIRQGTSVKDALLRLDSLAKDAILFVTSEEGRLIGSLTDGDVRRGFLKGFGIESLVDEIMHPGPRFIRKGDQDISRIIEYRENDFRIIPILDKSDHVVDIINFLEIKSFLPIDAVIMAGGRGERLRPLTDTTPKPLLKVGDKTILEHTLNHLSSFGIYNYWISLNYRGEQIESLLGDGTERKITIQYIKEPEPFGTIGAASLIENFEHDYVIVTNSDILTDLNYEDFFVNFIELNADFAVVTIPYKVDIPYAVLETNNGHVMSFKEKPSYTYYSNGGIYLMKKSILNYIPKNTFYNSTDLMDHLIRNGKKVISYHFAGYWLDIGKTEDYAKAQRDIKILKF